MNTRASGGVPAEVVRKALYRAYSLGQIYWQYADSDFSSDHRRAEENEAKFNRLVEETIASLHRPDPIPERSDALDIAEEDAILNGDTD